MKLYLILFLSCLVIGCAAPGKNDNSTGVVIETKEEKREITAEDRKKIRENLDIFYEDNGKRWQQAKKEVLAMGQVGEEIFSLFMIKFYAVPKDHKNKHANLTAFWNRAKEELTSLGEKSVPYLIVAMAHPNMGGTGRYLCSVTLIEIGSPSIPSLLQNLGKGDDKFQRTLLETLGTIGDPSASPAISDHYKELVAAINPNLPYEEETDPSYGSRYYCVKALGVLNSSEHLATIDQATRDPSELVRRGAVDALVNISSAEAIPYLEKAYKQFSASPNFQAIIRHRIEELDEM